MQEGKSTKVTYHFTPSTIEAVADTQSSSSSSNSINKAYSDHNASDESSTFVHPFVSQTLIRYLLPKGFPSTVDAGYLSFVKYQMLSSMASTAGGVLSMQSLLYALGLGSAAGALPLAATLNWILKDGIGQLGGIVFAGLINNRFDSNPKQWRVLSSIALDAASLLEIMIAFVPTYFLPMASVANIGKNISFLAASASRAAIHKSFAKHENLADITAKTASQTILSSTIGTALGIGASLLVDNNIHNVLGIYSLTASLSAYWMYLSMTHVTLKTLDLARLDFVLHHWLRTSARDQAPSEIDTNKSAEHVESKSTNPMSETQLLSPWEVKNRESIWLTSSHPMPLAHLHIGSALPEVFSSATEASEILPVFSEEQYLINYYSFNTQAATVQLLYKEGCTRDGMLRGLVHSYLIRSALAQGDDKQLQVNKVELMQSTLRQSYTLSADRFCARGWVLDEMLFEPVHSRVSV